ncbi:hypothetical protein [Streptomyces sp. NL15-2K]|uniref:hypothetical protein n=1 Tax=Streptomyces sp. NL15-2K TaxID=376149 RepID=UPI000F5891D3|nr:MULTISPECIES: hypothetical protein [Actinomycetes]WKX15499.1 hypothetical protein Q4V64_51580 [Kutzneria buriramensis]GCB52685.1 hypothetical protein SNL152K_10042 [Streptomyces sp. NL15-2K]
MPEPVLTALALTGATTVVAAMATDAWQATRAGVNRLFRREGATQAAIDGQLEGGALLVAQAAEADAVEQARQALVPVWQLHFQALLRDHPEVADELRTLITEVRAALPQSRQNWTQTNVARDGSTVYAAQRGNVYHYQQPPAAPPVSPAGPAPGVADTEDPEGP